MAFWGMPGPSVDICIGAFPAATFKTAMSKKRKEKVNYYFIKEIFKFLFHDFQVRPDAKN